MGYHDERFRRHGGKDRRTGTSLATLSAYGYDPAYSDGDAYYAQFMADRLVR